MKFWFAIFSTLILYACNQQQQKLPFLGNPVATAPDTVYPIIADFSFMNQDSQVVSNSSFHDKIYVADFIFLSCPTICPKMTKEMYKAYLPFATNDRVAFISHTIDPERDSIPRLKAYAVSLGVKTPKWNFVTGNADSIYNLAEHSYYSAAYPDSIAPGGFTHSGGLLLIDKNRHIRGVYNGTKPEDTQRLIDDIRTLLKE